MCRCRGPSRICRVGARHASESLLTSDQVTLLETDNVVSDTAKAEGRTLEGLGIAPQSLAAILPSYLWRYRQAGQFTKDRAA